MTKISYIKTYHAPPQVTTLAKFVRATMNPDSELAQQVKLYRQTKHKRLKESLPMAIVGAICKGGHARRHVVKRTGWIALDIDAADNPHLKDAAAVRDAVANFGFVAFAGLSVSGRGVWALVRIKDPEKQAKHFEQLQKDFEYFGITLDSSKGANANDKRYYSFDPDAYVADEFTVYDRLPAEKPPAPQPTTKRYTGSKDVFSRGMTHVRNSGFTFTHGVDMHNSIFQLCSFLNFKGIPQRDAESFINNNVFPLSEIRSNCITAPYKQYVPSYGKGADSSTTVKYRVPKPGSTEYAEATLAMINDASPAELKEFYNL